MATLPTLLQDDPVDSTLRARKPGVSEDKTESKPETPLPASHNVSEQSNSADAPSSANSSPAASNSPKGQFGGLSIAHDIYPKDKFEAGVDKFGRSKENWTYNAHLMAADFKVRV